MKRIVLLLLGLAVQRWLAADDKSREADAPDYWAHRSTRTDTDEVITLRDLQLKEAEWVWEEMEDFVKLIQRYRGLFITAVFAAVGWLLGRALEDVPGGVANPETLLALRRRPDIAAVLCIVPILATLFVVLMLEAQFQIQSLARYRYLLGVVLGNGTPVWRWELWKEIPEGSVRAWTNPSNIYFGLAALILTAGALWFSWPALETSASLMLTVFWWGAVAVTSSFVILAVALGIKNMRTNRVARPLDKELWEHLWSHSRKDRRTLRDD
jgi:hypothetical protein